MPVHHPERPRDPFSTRFDACLAAYDDAGGNPDKKKHFKERVRDALLAEKHDGPSIDPYAAASHLQWPNILAELDHMQAALVQSRSPLSGSQVAAAYRPEYILELWEPVLVHRILAFRATLVGKFPKGGTVYDPLDQNRFIRRMRKCLETFREGYRGTPAAEKVFLKRLHTALTSSAVSSSETIDDTIDLNQQFPAPAAWISILQQLENLNTALVSEVATSSSEREPHPHLSQQLLKILFEELTPLEVAIRTYRMGNRGQPAVGHSEHSLDLQTSRALHRRQVYVPLARSSV